MTGRDGAGHAQLLPFWDLSVYLDGFVPDRDIS
jgi:hypothetical protein